MRVRLKDDKWIIVSKTVCSIMILLCGILWTLLYGYLHKATKFLLYRNLVLAVFVALLIIFVYFETERKKLLFSWNTRHMGRFTFLVCLFMAFLAGAGEIPYLAAPVFAGAVILTVFSGSYCGMVSYSAIVLHYCILNGLDVAQVIVLLLTGLTGALLFMTLDRNLRYGGILFACLAADFVCYSLFFVMTREGQALGDALLYTGIRLFSAFVVLMITLKMLGTFCIYRNDKKLSEINSPDYKLLTELKGVSKEAYLYCIHTSYLSEKVARKVGADVPLAKAGGFYIKIGMIEGEDTLNNTIHVATKNGFPSNLIRLLKEYGTKNAKKISREAVIVQLSAAMVATVSLLFRKDKNASLNFEKIIDVIIKKKMDSGDFEHCDLTMEELHAIKKGFVEEKLYYDFLR